MKKSDQKSKVSAPKDSQTMLDTTEAMGTSTRKENWPFKKNLKLCKLKKIFFYRAEAKHFFEIQQIVYLSISQSY